LTTHNISGSRSSGNSDSIGRGDESQKKDTKEKSKESSHILEFLKGVLKLYFCFIK